MNVVFRTLFQFYPLPSFIPLPLSVPSLFFSLPLPPLPPPSPPHLLHLFLLLVIENVVLMEQWLEDTNIPVSQVCIRIRHQTQMYCIGGNPFFTSGMLPLGIYHLVLYKGSIIQCLFISV